MSNDKAGPKWTPGPWKKVDRSEYRMSANDPRWEIDQASGQSCFWVALAINEADANVLAAAPDLYAVVEMLTLSIVSDPRMLARFDGEDVAAALAVLRKARGESCPGDDAALAKARGEEPTADKGRA